MEFRIADTFTSSLLKLTGQEQKAVKTTAFDLQLNPANPGVQLHKLDRAKDSNFWSARVNKDIRLIIHRTDESLLLCYVDHHDNAYAWASRRKIENHPKTGAAQLVEIRETVEEVVLQQPIAKSTESPQQIPLFAQISDDELLSYGIPLEWLKDVRSATEDTLLEITGHLPQEAAEALVELATGGKPKQLIPLPADINPFEHPDAQHHFQTINNVEELERALADSWGDGTAFLPSQQKLPGIPYFYPRDLGSATFVGREDEFEQLHQLLQGPQRVGIVALTGMGGVGKTELAWQYADRYSQSYPGGIWWLSGANLVGDVLTCGTRMGLAVPEELQTHEAQVQWYYDRWVESIPSGLRLLIWDDVTNYRQLRALLPQDGQFRVLLTTRAKLGPPVQRLDLNVLEQGETLNLLRCLVGDSKRIDAEVEVAQGICQWLGYLPLGIELVGRHLAGRPTLRLQTLLERLNAQRLNAQAIQQVPSETPYKESLKAAFELSWQLLNDTSKQVGCLLSIFALAPVRPEWVTTSLPEWDAEVVEEALETLFRWSLLTLDQGQYLLHPLIHEFFAHKLNNELSETAESLQRNMAKAMVVEATVIKQPLTLTQLAQVQTTVSHWQVVADKLTALLEGIDVLWPFAALARVAMSQNHWLEAEKWCRACLRKSEERFGETHRHTADSLDILAGLCQAMGRYAEALPLYERALVICEKEVGIDHPETAITLNNLAILHYSMGHYESALPLYERSLAIRENKLGRTHPDTAESLNNMAVLYEVMGRYGEALPLHERALEITEQELGPSHPDMALELNNLAQLYKKLGRYEEALALSKRSLEIYQAEFGNSHPDTATSLNNLAKLYFMMDRYSDALPLYEQALAIRKNELGPSHPDTAESLNGLAELNKAVEYYEESLRLYERALAIRTSKLGDSHPDTALSLSGLAGLYAAMGQDSAAESTYIRALSILSSSLGEDHPTTHLEATNFRIFVQQVIQKGDDKKLSDHPLTQETLRDLIEWKSQENTSL